MTGLEQIIRQIEDDAAASVVSIRQKAEEEAAQSHRRPARAGKRARRRLPIRRKNKQKVSKAVRNRPRPYRSGRAFSLRNRRSSASCWKRAARTWKPFQRWSISPTF